MRSVLAAAVAMLLGAGSHALNSADIGVANGYDDDWEYLWASTMHNVNNSFTGTAGLVVHVGDSITYSNQATRWIRSGAGRTAADNAIRSYIHVDDANHSIDGVYLARFDVTNGSYTAESSMGTQEYLTNPPYGLPSCDEMFVTGNVGATYNGYSNLVGSRAAEICLLLLGTNDLDAGRSAAAYRANLVQIVTKIMRNNNTVVCLITIPPRRGYQSQVQAYNAEVRDIARSGLVISGVNGGNRVYFPLVDYYKAIMLRRETDWDGTLIGGDGVHPSAYSGDPNPYANSGQALSDYGYLLRCWLWVQKIEEIKDYCVDGNLPPSSGLAADAGPDQDNVAAGSSVQLDGSGSTGAATHLWEYLADSDATPALSDANVAEPTFAAGGPGLDYHLKLTVTDGAGGTDTDEVWVRVDPAYAVAAISGQTRVSPETAVILSGTDSWTWNSAVDYSWSVTPVPADLSGQATDAISFTVGGEGETYLVTLSIDDTQGHGDSVSVTVVVASGNSGSSSDGLSCAAGPPRGDAVFACGFLVAVLVARKRRDTKGIRPPAPIWKGAEGVQEMRSVRRGTDVPGRCSARRRGDRRHERGAHEGHLAPGGVLDHSTAYDWRVTATNAAGSTPCGRRSARRTRSSRTRCFKFPWATPAPSLCLPSRRATSSEVPSRGSW